MNKATKILCIFLTAAIASTVSTPVLAAENPADIDLKPGTILEKNYENNGIAGLYDLDIFSSEADEIFKKKTDNERARYENILSTLFYNRSENVSVEKQVTELNLFSEVSYHASESAEDESSDASFFVFSGLILIFACLFGFFGSKIINKSNGKRRRGK